VRSGAGHLILTDEHQGPERVPMPMILATSAVHSWLTRQGLRTFCSLNVRSAECIDPHYFAVLIGCGATTVNAYLAQDTWPTGWSRGLLEGTLTEAVARYRKAIDQGLLKIMSKMGISVMSSYRGGLNFEAVGLSRHGGGILPRHDQPDFRHRRPGHPEEDGRGACRGWRDGAGHAAGRRLLQGALGRDPCLGRAGRCT
jgi:hypothetical protein